MNLIRVAILFFIVASVALAGIIALELQEFKPDSKPALPRNPAVGAGVPAESARPVRPKSVDAYDAVSQRPLFFESRRPIETDSAAGKDTPSNALKNIGLTGIIITPDKKTALVYSPKSPTLLYLEEGQSIEGWRLDKVLRDRIVLSDGDKTAEIIIWDKSRPRPSKAPKPPSRSKPAVKQKTSPAKPAQKR